MEEGWEKTGIWKYLRKKEKRENKIEERIRGINERYEEKYKKGEKRRIRKVKKKRERDNKGYRREEKRKVLMKISDCQKY